jgi:RND family efflux transporter MFP subunit
MLRSDLVACSLAGLGRRLAAPALALAVAALAVGCDAKKDSKIALPEGPPVPKAAASDAPAEGDKPAAGEAPAAEAAKAAETPPAATPKAEAPATVPPPAVAETVARLTGEVAAPRRSLLAFRQQGFIEAVKAKAGALVKKGDVLATLEPQDFELRLDLARARRDQGKVAFASADKELRRERQLASENASTATALDRVQAQYDQARLALKLAELDVLNAQRALDDTKLLAPYDCIVAEQLKDQAEWVRVGDGVFNVFDTQLPEIKLAAPERLMGKIEVGDALQVVVPSAGFSGRAQVVRMVPVISEKTRTFQVIARPDGNDQRIVPGSYAEALLN